MHPHTEESDPQLARFTDWLKSTGMAARPDMAARVRARMQAEGDPIEAAIDRLFAQDPTLHDDRLAWRVRGRVQQQERRRAEPAWQAWLAPLAAAAMLTLAFISFQTAAPRAAHGPAPEQAVAALSVAAPELDPELTRIFALAANLQGKANMSGMQSLDDLASLFD